jgi:glutamate/tyrosine decarboxylase-like PLP-dependent enzyme
MPDLYLLGNADAMIVCFDSKTLNIYDVLDAMSRKGWSLNSHQNPRCIHICVTVTHVGHAHKLLQDLNDCVLSIKNNSKNGNAKSNSSAAIYGMTTALPAGPINEILKIYNDVVLDN